MEFGLWFILELVLFHISRASLSLDRFQMACSGTYLPCETLRRERSTWKASYFDHSILPDNQQRLTENETLVFAQTWGATCGAKLPNTNHTLLCSEDALTLVPPKKPRNAIVFMHGLQRRQDIAIYLPFFSRLLSDDSELTSSLQIDHPLAPFRKLTAGQIVSPPIRKARAWFDVVGLPANIPIPIPAEPSTLDDRLGLYRTAEFIDAVVHSQCCKLSIPCNRVVLMGQSLGAVATLEAVLATDIPLAGAVAMSGFLPRASDYLIPGIQAFSARERKYTVTMIHGRDDEVIPFALGNATAEIVKSAVESTGGAFRFVGVKDADHFRTFFQSPELYTSVRNALREAFYCQPA
ncbi:unnamed protein product [Agarophyton chilense]|eukprot:gb/GEZJ01000209.1/.p1 GENE.gb/GEZJ01000209.1/~~gb/GEZJ01000209.1/.p1  ORF type:complete len:351 (+),score=25.66 gb/GEZJ01000209.1/:783-1835(+)